MPRYDTVQVQYDDYSDRWWLYRLDAAGWNEDPPQPYNSRDKAVKAATALYDAGEAKTLSIYDANGAWESTKSRVNMKEA